MTLFSTQPCTRTILKMYSTHTVQNCFGKFIIVLLDRRLIGMLDLVWCGASVPAFLYVIVL